jgi:PAS domain S-box-containing protein
MSETERNWAELGEAAARDAGLASSVTGGALLLWNVEAGRPGFADAGAQALFGGRALTTSLPGPTLQRLKVLASGLAPSDRVRLERLRLTGGFAASLITCGVKMISQADGEPVLAIAVPATELRRLGVAVPATPAAFAPAPAKAAEAAPQQTTPAKAPRALVRFLWTSDPAGRLASLSPDISELVGPEGAAALVGRNWAELVGQELIDRDGGLAERFVSGATWSGHHVLWRTATAGEGARVEISGVPVLDAARQISGYRGFGLARLTEREPFPQAEPAPDAPQVTAVAEASASPEAETPVAAILTETLPQAEATVLAEPQAEEQPPLPGDSPDTTPVAAAATEADTSESEATASPAAETDAEITAEQEALADAGEEAELDESEAPALADDARETDPAEPAQEPSAADNIVQLRNGNMGAVRPVLEPSKPNLSTAERNAFREIAKALGARIAGDDEIEPRLPPAAPLRLKDSEEPRKSPRNRRDEARASITGSEPLQVSGEELLADTARPRLPNSHADVLDRLPIAVLVNRGEEPLYANRTLLDLLDYADLADLTAGGGVSSLIREAARSEGGQMILVDRRSNLVSVDAVLSSLSWQGEAATLMAFRHPSVGGEVKVLTPEEAEEAELAAEFEAEDAESAARVDALRLDLDVRTSRISELVAMLDTATDGVVTVDERGRILSLNKTAEALFGYDQREVTGELFTLLFGAESHAPALDYLEGLKGGGVASVLNDGREIAGRVRQGGKIPLFMTMGQIAEAPERRFCAVLRDITAWKKTEGDLVEARKAAEKASAQKSDVLAKISHEIRTPLNAIIGFAEVMAEERFGPIANERYKEYLRDIHQSGGYVISLVNDLLDLAKIEAGKLDLDFVSVNLNEIALSAVALLQPEANRGRVVLRSGLSPKLPPVVADQRSIRQIVINLLSNAVKFTDAGGQVIVSTALGDQGEAILRVRDTGIGMDDNEIALALEPFRQVPTTRRSGGTGLGLPLTKALVEANRAAMAITSVKKEGTLVEITFPPQRVLAG